MTAKDKAFLLHRPIQCPEEVLRNNSSPFLRVATLGYLDRTTELTGFGEAMLRIGAIEQSEDGLKILWNPKNPTATPQIL